MESRSATCRLVSPLATSSATWRWVGVRPPSRACRTDSVRAAPAPAAPITGPRGSAKISSASRRAARALARRRADGEARSPPAAFAPSSQDPRCADGAPLPPRWPHRRPQCPRRRRSARAGAERVRRSRGGCDRLRALRGRGRRAPPHGARARGARPPPRHRPSPTVRLVATRRIERSATCVERRRSIAPAQLEERGSVRIHHSPAATSSPP